MTSLAVAPAAGNETTSINPLVGERPTLSARLPPVPVVLDTSALIGGRARIFLRLADLTPDGPAIAGVHWRARGFSSGALPPSGERLLVFDGVISGPSLETVFDFEVHTTAKALNGTSVLHPVFEVERVAPGSQLSHVTLPAHTRHGEQLLLPIPASMLSTDDGASGVRNADQPGGVVITPTGRGVRLARGVRGMRMSVLPEATDNHGLSLGGVFASTLFGGAAAIMGTTSDGRDEVMFNSAWPLGPGRLLVTVGQQREQLAFGFRAGTMHEQMTQRGAGIGYDGTLTAAWATQLAVQAYAYGTPSRDAGTYAYMVDTDSTREFFAVNERVAGSQLFGLQSRGSFSPLAGTRITLAAGAERLGYDYQTGRESATTATAGAALAQQLPSRFRLQVSEDRHAAHTLRRLSIGRSFLARHYIDGTFQAVDGRKGMRDDLRFRVSYAFSFGQSGARARGAGDLSMVDALLDQVSARPSFMPYSPLARVDHTVAPQRLVVVHKDALPEHTTIDPSDGTVTVLLSVDAIVSVTRNGLSFTNTGQFSHGADRLLVHPMHMEHPAPGAIDWYVVVLRDGDGTLTDVTVEVQRGSLRVVSVVVGEARTEDEPADEEPADEEPADEEPADEEPAGEEPADTTPDAFTFAARQDVALSTEVESETIVVSGIDAPAAISITNGEYRIDGGAYTSAPGTVTNGQTVTVRVTSSASYVSTVTATLTIGGVSGTFEVTTEAEPENTTPDAFTFAARQDVAPATEVASAAIAVSGINAPAPISITDGEYSIDGGAYTSAPGTVTNGQSVTVRVMSSASYLSTVTATLTIGGVSGTFTVTTEAEPEDTTPDAFSFPAKLDVARSTGVTSDSIVVGGINAPAAISVSNGSYSINGGTFTSAAGTVTNGDVVHVRQTSSSSFSTATVATLTIGGVAGAFSVTTEAMDTTPNAFSFPTLHNVNHGSTQTSASITVSGINAPAQISVSGHSSSRYSINGGTFIDAVGTVQNGDTVRVRHTASSSDLGSRTTTLTIGGVSGTFTTISEDD